MIHFECEYCGRKLKVPETHSGRRSRCPACGRELVIPSSSSPPPLELVRDESPPPTTGPAGPSPDAPPGRAPARAPRRSDADAVRWSERELVASLGPEETPEYTGERKHSLLIDLLLYPASPSGLIVLGIVIGGPYLIIVTRAFLLLPGFGGLLLFVLTIGVFGIYQWWYFAECMYDSARGGTRAPDLLVPSVSDMWSRVSYMLAVPILYLLPTILYGLLMGPYDAVFVGLAAWAILMFPIGLVAMVVDDSISALNPLFLANSIRRVFLPYLGLLPVLAIPLVLWPLLRAAVIAILPIPPELVLVAALVLAYGSLIYAHILGRFYWRHRDRLDWGL